VERAQRQLGGWRGGLQYDVQALVQALCNLSNFAVAHAAELSGIDINPFVVQTTGGVCLDALISTNASA
jgi:succinyl-CoA synthetase beta subunit